MQFNQIDWEMVIRVLVSEPIYTGRQIFRNQAGFDNDIVWQDARTKPTWAQIVDAWTNPLSAASGVIYDRHAPGDIKISPMTIDHGNWLFVDSVTGRILSRTVYPILFHVIGTTYDSLYPGITALQFGLPIPGGRTLMIAGASHPLGLHGGANALLASIPGQGTPNSPRSQAYWVGGNLFVFAGKLKYT